MSRPNRRRFSSPPPPWASAAWGGPAAPSKLAWTERRDLYPAGRGLGRSGPGQRDPLDPPARPGRGGAPDLELAEDRLPARGRHHQTEAQAAMGWTTRVLAGGLKPHTVYWYRFTDAAGAGSRIGRTITAPGGDDPARPLHLRLLPERQPGRPERLSPDAVRGPRGAGRPRLNFVLHLGDFIYELVWYPEDRPAGCMASAACATSPLRQRPQDRDYPRPTTLDDYPRGLCRLPHRPGLQDARAHWPFVAMGDNHEFSWKGWQSQVQYDGPTEPARPARRRQPGLVRVPAVAGEQARRGLNAFDAPKVQNALLTRFDDHGLGRTPTTWPPSAR
jgi:alkaline phosphatase D